MLHLRRRVGILVSTLAAYVALHVLWLATPSGAAELRVAVADGFLLPLFLLSCIAAVRVSRHDAVDVRARRAWRWLAGSYALLWIANVLWTVRDLVPSAASLTGVGRLFAFASYLPMLVGLLALPSAPRGRSARIRFALDLATALMGAGLVIWWLVLPPSGISAFGGPLQTLIGLTPPVADFAVVAVLTAMLLGRLDHGSRLALRLLATGHGLSVVAGLASAWLTNHGRAPASGDWVDAVWIASSVLLIAAADVQYRSAAPASDGAVDDVSRASDASGLATAHAPDAVMGTSVLPYVGVAVGYLLLLLVARPWWSQPLGVIALGSAGLTTLMVARHLLSVRENRRLVAARLAQEAYFRGLIEHAADVVYVVALDGTLHFASASTARVFGRVPRSDGSGQVLRNVHPDDVPAARAALAAAAASPIGAPCSVQARVRHEDGGWRIVEAAVRRLPDVANRMVLNVRDVTERVHAESALRESQRALSTMLSNLPGMAYRCRNDREWTMEFVSDGCAALTGHSASELTSDVGAPSVPFATLIHPDDRERVWTTVQHAIETAAPFQLAYRIRTADGEERHVWEQGRAVVGAAGEIRALEGILLDVTERTCAEAERERLVAQRDAERALLAAVIEQLPAAVVIAEAPSGRLVLGNGQVARIFGNAMPGASALSAYASQSGFHDDGRPVESHEWPLARAVAGERVHGEEYRYPRPDEPEAWVRVSAGPVRDRDGRIVAGVAVAEDVTQRRRLEGQLAHQAFHDPLTGLANRALFRDRVEHALAQAHRTPGGVAVLFLDLDDFKAVNDSLGHGEGDQLLVQVAARLLGTTRGCDTVARLGGDEFAVLLQDAIDGDAHIVANRILSSLTRTVRVGARELSVGASIGIAVARPEDGAEELLRNADLAMYQAKARGKGMYEVFAPPMYEAVRDRVSLQADLHHALERREFRLVFQPLVELATERVVGVEALVRWDHPTRGAVSPTTFIPLAEESGIILPLGRWVLGEACRQAAAWQRRGVGAPYVAVNISGRQLQHPQLVADVATALGEAGLEPRALLLEITEGVVMHDTEASLRRLHDLKEIGVRLAIDDFGTGYSSLSYLQRFPMDVLKIDKAFVDDVALGGSQAALARTIVALGETLSLDTVAEGIETGEQSAALMAMGCRVGQGYWFARPVPAPEITAMLESGGVRATPAAATV